MRRLHDEPTRRRFLEHFCKTTFGVAVLGTLPGAASAADRAGKAKAVIYVYLRGGLSHIDTFDPKPDRPEMAGVKTIRTSAPGVQVSEWLPKLAAQMHRVA